MHHWLRQVGMHAALYRFWKAKNIEAGGGRRPEQALVQSLGGGAAPEQRRGERLQDLDRVKFLLMTQSNSMLARCTGQVTCDVGLKAS